MSPARREEARQPVSWHVARWGDDPFSRGSWSYIRPGGSPADRWTLAEPIDERFVLCGEAIGTDQPAMTHGAFDSGRRAAEWCASVAARGERVVVIGAGVAGLSAARTLGEHHVEAVVVEARDRVGGRVHTVSLSGSLAGADGSVVWADAGAAWLQQFPKNPLAARASELGIALVPTDFHHPLDAARSGDGRAGDVAGALAELVRASIAATRVDDCSVEQVVRAIVATDPLALQRALDADVVLESGASLDEMSARWFHREDGVGNDDHWLIDGYRTIVDDLRHGVDVRLGSPVTAVRWNDAGVALAMANGDDVRADRCICSVPISLLHRAQPVLDPGLPVAHRTALSRIGMGVVDKVLLRFDERWWPVPPEGYFRWYDTPASWCEWLDLTDGCGAPVVAGLIAHDAVARHHRGRTDAEVAAAATEALRAWASAVWGRT